MRRRFTVVEEPRLPPFSILNIRSKLVHSVICSFIPKQRILRIASKSKKLQNLCDFSIEDYEVYHILKSNKRKNFSLSERPLESALKTMRDIFELTKSELLYENHTEIMVPTSIHCLVQMKNFKIIAATEDSLLIIEYHRKKNTFNIVDEIKVNQANGVFCSLIDIGNNLLLASTIFHGYVINLDTQQVVFEVNGSCPIPLKDGRISYIVNENIIKITKMDEVGKEEEILIIKSPLKDEDCTQINRIQNGIQLKNGNILLISWDRIITEYDIQTKKCIQVIETAIDFMDTCYELKDGRIAITATDNGNIYLINRLKNKSDSVITLSGHNNTVIKILQLENEQIISSSYDGKVKIWYKIKDKNFNCAMTLYLFNDFIRAFLFMDDGRILITGDDKTLRALGVKNYIGNFTIEFQPEDKKNKIIKSFQLIDNRIH